MVYFFYLTCLNITETEDPLVPVAICVSASLHCLSSSLAVPVQGLWTCACVVRVAMCSLDCRHFFGLCSLCTMVLSSTETFMSTPVLVTPVLTVICVLCYPLYPFRWRECVLLLPGTILEGFLWARHYIKGFYTYFT